MKKYLFVLSPIEIVCILFCLLSSTLYSQTGPGGIGGYADDIEPGEPENALWLRAEDLIGTLNNGDEVTSWEDFSGYGHEALMPEGRNDLEAPVFKTNKINGFPWVEFHGNSFLVIPDHHVLDGGSGGSMFAVTRRLQLGVNGDTTKNHNHTIVCKRKHWNAWSHIPEICLDTTCLQHAYEIRFEDQVNKVTNKYGSSMVAYINGNLPDGNGQDCYVDYRYSDTTVNYLVSWVYNSIWGGTLRVDGEISEKPGRGEGNPNPIYVGNIMSSTADLYVGASELDPPGQFGDNPDKDDPDPDATEENYLNAAITEIIIYKGELDSTQMIIVENYLKAKYNLTLNDDFIRYSDENYTQDVAGIGNESGEDLHNESVSHALTVEGINESVNADEYVMFGHDGTAYDVTSDDVPNGYERWTRAWKFEAAGEAEVKLTFNFSEAGIKMDTKNLPSYAVLYRADEESDFTALTPSPSKLFNSLVFEIPSDELATGYYTIGLNTGGGTDVIKDINGFHYLNIFPNPASDFLNLEIDLKQLGNIEVEIMDLSGRNILHKEFVANSTNFSERLNILNLKQGAYLINIKQGTFKLTRPLLISR